MGHYWGILTFFSKGSTINNRFIGGSHLFRLNLRTADGDIQNFPLPSRSNTFHLDINFFRGTPLFVQILLIHFGVMPMLMSEINPAVSALVALSLNATAYIAEIFRGGIQSIDRGQMEAARSLGMTNIQAMRYIIIPQAFKRMIPRK